MDRIIIPDEIYIGLQIRPKGHDVKSSDGSDKIALAFVTYKNTKGKIQHEDTLNRWRDDEIMRFPFDNQPTKDMNVAGFVSRWRTQNKFIRVEDPRGFQTEIPVENFIDIIQNCNLEKGIVKDELVWGWVRGNLRLYAVDSNDYKEGRKNFNVEGSPNISIKDVNAGDRVLLGNGKEGVYVGGWHIVENGYGYGRGNFYDYILFHQKYKFKSKRVYFIKDGDEIKKYSSLKVKEIISHEEINADEIYEMLKKRSARNCKLEIAKVRAHRDIEAARTNSFSTRWQIDRREINEKYGLNPEGYYLKDEDPAEFRRNYDLSSIMAISDKPIKDTIFIDKILKE